MKIFSFGLAVVAALLAVLPEGSLALNPGKARGLASGATGGGSIAPVYPTTIAELKSYLSSSSPQVIILNKTFDFRGSEGTKTETGCRPPQNTQCIASKSGYKGQDCIVVGSSFATTGGCNNGSPVTITYDVAGAKNPLTVSNNKTIRGDGLKGVIAGKGLWLTGDNIIIQNIHITNLNPHLIWGGDAIYLQGTNGGSVPNKNIWIDHVKISKIGREMLTTGFGGTDSMTVSNCDFDGQTEYSASCDGRHYWTMMLIGDTAKISFLNNYMHHTSGRAPKVGGKAIFHAANNHFFNCSGHNFNPIETSFTIAEGNYFEATSQNMMFSDSTAAMYAETYSNGANCKAAVGRSCIPNIVVSSKTALANQRGSAAINGASAVAKTYTPTTAGRKTVSTHNFGVGTLAGI